MVALRESPPCTTRIAVTYTQAHTRTRTHTGTQTQTLPDLVFGALIDHAGANAGASQCGLIMRCFMPK